MTENEKAAAAVLETYSQALNRSDMEQVMALYAPDGVFMPQGSPSSIGADAVRKAYEAVFANITLAVRFEIAEIQELSPEWVFARTNSAGSVKIHATGASSAEANQELFLLQKLGGEWKIARYCFSTTNPPRE